jgi:hypothetical protein
MKQRWRIGDGASAAVEKYFQSNDDTHESLSVIPSRS